MEKIVTLFMLNNDNELLIQKRSKQKGGKYGFLSGHVNAGETSREGLSREVKEEIGFNIKDREITHFHTEKAVNNTYDFYFLKENIEIENLTLQKEEVDEVEWFAMNEIEDLIKNENFFANHIEVVDIIKKYMKNSV